MDLVPIATCEYEAFAAPTPHDTIVMASVTAPDVSQGHARAPVNLCCVLDKSGSMQGKKLEMVKWGMEFVIAQLKPEDALSLVVFDSNVKTVLKLRKMTDDGRTTALQVIKAITAGSSTNLSGGLLQGLSLFQPAPPPPPPAAQVEEGHQPPGPQAEVASLFLFTDGLANEGITEESALVQAVGTTLKTLPPCTIFTFGFGEDHSASMLKAIADAGRGMYYYIQTEEEIPPAFSECLGGLLTVAVQNLKVEFRVADAVAGYELLKVLSSYKATPNPLPPGGRVVELSIGDMYSEEHKDLLFLIRIPPAPTAEGGVVVATARLSYFSVASGEFKVVPLEFRVDRVTAEAAAAMPQQPKPVIDRQRNRIYCADALEEAARLGAAGNSALARQVLQGAIDRISRSATGTDPFCAALIADLQGILATLESDVYVAQNLMHNAWGSHQQQRCTAAAFSISSPQWAQQAYGTSAKMTMMHAATPPRDSPPPVYPQMPFAAMPARGPPPFPPQMAQQAHLVQARGPPTPPFGSVPPLGAGAAPVELSCPPSLRGVCPWGAKCSNHDPKHRSNYSHPQ